MPVFVLVRKPFAGPAGTGNFTNTGDSESNSKSPTTSRFYVLDIT